MTDKNNMSNNKSDKKYIQPEWPAPSNVQACMTTRHKRYSEDKYGELNFAQHMNDKQLNILQSRLELKKDLKFSQQPFWLQQTHSNYCVPWSNEIDKIQADASFSTEKNQVCSVLTADCLPILLTSKSGDWVAACHAGWRGLLAGIIQNTLMYYSNKKSQLIAWIGPAILQEHFEVGEEVKDAFVHKNKDYSNDFVGNSNDRYQFDFVSVAKKILNSQGVECFGGDLCTYANKKDFYSYRRDGETGRMARLIWFQ